MRYHVRVGILIYGELTVFITSESFEYAHYSPKRNRSLLFPSPVLPCIMLL